MTSSALIKTDPKLDLVLERVVDVPRELVWKVWTTPEHLKPWFCPKPWSTPECEIDLRQGGMFRTVMVGPNGERFDNSGCYLEIVPNERLIWTDALLPGYRPSKEPFMTAMLELEPAGKGSRYRATALHRDPEARAKHEEMGFHQGWGTVLDQLVEYVKGM